MRILLSSRYAFSKTAHHRASSIRIVITTALSLSMVVIVISIMDYLQSSRFDAIRAVRSFDLVVEGKHESDLKSLYPDATIFEYGEGEALIAGNAFFVRYINSSYNGGLRFLTGNSDSLAIPYSLYRSGITNLNVSMLREGRSGVVLPRTLDIGISGVYTSRMGAEFDSTMVFLSMDYADNTISYKTAIQGISIEEKKNLMSLGYEVTTWKEAEAGLYSAFLVEKTMMYVVLTLLFLIIGVSTKQSVRIFYREKRGERAELEILGLSIKVIDSAFLLSFLWVFLLGVIFAFILSLLLLPLVENIGDRYISLFMSLEFPYIAFICFSLLLILLIMLFSSIERRKDKILDLVEVVNGR